MITNENEAKKMTKHIACDLKYKSNSSTFKSNQEWNNKNANASVKIIVSVKNIIVRILVHALVRIVSI